MILPSGAVAAAFATTFTPENLCVLGDLRGELFRVDQVQLVFTAILVGVLAGSVLTFVVMGWFQRARRIALTRTAHATKMHFSPEDPFGLIRRYAEFALIGGGHSARANNVTYGRVEGCPVRAFDFRYEVGHGTRRQTRRYSVLAVETPFELPAVLMWNEAEWALGSLSARRCDGSAGRWRYRGSEDIAHELAAVREDAHRQDAGMQACGPILLVWAPASRRGWKKYAIGPEEAPDLLHAIGALGKGSRLRRECPATRPGDEGELLDQVVENAPET